VGTAAETTAGMKEAQFVTVAALMARALRSRNDDAAIAQVRGEVAELCSLFNPYGGFTKL
jgi:glycine/serine hydroxymethyltransferase